MWGGPRHCEHVGGWKVCGGLQRRWSGAVSGDVVRWRKSGRYHESRYFRGRERTMGIVSKSY